MRRILRRPVSFKTAYEEFLGQMTWSAQRYRMYLSLYNAVERYYRFYHLSGSLDSFSVQGLLKLKSYLENENRHMIDSGLISRDSRLYLRGRNTINDMMRKLRVFLGWCKEAGYLAESPFMKIRIENDVYATPYYLYMEERKALEALDLEPGSFLCMQRDVFLFQCCIGCRYGDMVRMKMSNVNGGFIEYFASKTLSTAPRKIRVPLNTLATEILRRYEPHDAGLLPFVNLQRYNRAIKRILKMAGVDRKVSVMSSRTGEIRQEYIYDLAGSHLARRTFIGNLYKFVRDPNLIGSMTGHVEGSKAFCRYREIDDDIKIDLVMKIQ